MFVVCISLGDFNAVQYAKERFNSTFCHYVASDFNKFIEDVGLHEHNLGGESSLISGMTEEK